MVHYKFSYFNVRALGEGVRLLFALAGQEYESVRVDFADWPTLKPKTPLGQLPVLEIDGVPYPQSQAIIRYLARKFGYAGKTAEEELLVDVLTDSLRDFFLNYVRPYIRATKFEIQPKEEQDKIRANLETGAIEWFGKLTEYLKKSGSGFLAPTGITHADLTIADNITTVKGIIPHVLNNFPEVAAFYQRVHDIPNIAKYVATRPQTDI